jgi:hypothetical protein
MASKNLPPRTTAQQQQQQQQQQEQENNPSPPPIRKIASNQPRPPTSASNQQQQNPPPKINPSPSHLPNTATAGQERVYILTLHTTPSHHARLTALRGKYFPRHLNKLSAHLTLFHALPGSKLHSSIIPTIEDIALHTTPFEIHATKAFRLKKGIAIAISKEKGGKQGQAVHRELQRRWGAEGFLSEQDAGGCRLHYTIMNKVDDEDEVEKAFREVVGSFGGDEGVAEGLALWRYDRGFWRAERTFLFARV